MNLIPTARKCACLRAAGALALTLIAGCATTAHQPPNPLAEAAQSERTAGGLEKKNPAKAIGLYLSVAEKAFAIASDKTAAPAAREQALAIYNAALAHSVAAMQKQAGGVLTGSTQVFSAAGKTYLVRVAPARGESRVNPGAFDRVIAASEISKKQLGCDVQRDGMGGQLIGVLKADGKRANCPPAGFAEPLTAIAEFGRPDHTGKTQVTLSLYNPQNADQVTVGSSRFPLAGDFSAPLAYYPQRNEILIGIAAMLRSDRVVARTGIYFYEPYDPNKIPVLFVHGLMSSPHVWLHFINELNKNPDFRKRYQAWVFLYPSGAPIVASAVRLRRALAELAVRYPLRNNMVMVGHSMGGILTKMQVSNSRDDLWRGIFGRNAEKVSAQFPADSPIREALFFKANPHIARVIFIATPHLGSRLATLRIAGIVGSLIRLPAKVVSAVDPKVLKSVLRGIDPSFRSPPTSIAGLSPKSPLLQSVRKLPPTVPYHSIIGNRGRTNEALADSSDGFVPYWSSHLPEANSEIIVPTGHDAFNHPDSVAEVLRILAL